MLQNVITQDNGCTITNPIRIVITNITIIACLIVVLEYCILEIYYEKKFLLWSILLTKVQRLNF